MAPAINNFDITSVANHSGNKMVKLMSFVSEPTCNNGGQCATTMYNYLPGLLILIVLFLIIFFSLKSKGYETVSVLTACCITNLIIALLLFPLHVISGSMLVVSIILVPLAGFLLLIQS